jgi:hypothetical protein
MGISLRTRQSLKALAAIALVMAIGGLCWVTPRKALASGQPAGGPLEVFPAATRDSSPSEFAADGKVVRQFVRAEATGPNHIVLEAARPYGKGFTRQGDIFVCRSQDRESQWGVVFSVELNQEQPVPILAEAESRAEDVSGTPDPDYSLYLDLLYTDGTPLWGQSAAFSTGSHDWQSRRVVVYPEKPVRRVSYYLLFRNHSGRVAFRNPRLHVLEAGKGAVLFDGLPVIRLGSSRSGFSVRDVRAQSDFVAIDKEALGLRLDYHVTDLRGAQFIDLTLRSLTTEDRAITLVYAVPVPRKDLVWFQDPRRSEPVRAGREYLFASNWQVGNRRLSRYPFAAVGTAQRGFALGIDMLPPAFFRCGYNAGTEELFVAYDLALTQEKPRAQLRLVSWTFDPEWGFRNALASYYELFPEHFQVRISRQGLWMPFARISAVKGWEDFGFRFKEGTNETAWDDAHDILTFRYTEPMTWWMPMPPEMPRTYEAAVRLAEEQAAAGKPQALAWKTSSFRSVDGKIPARLLDTPWCNGAVWSMNSMPDVPGEITDFSLKWNDRIRQEHYGPEAKAQLDGEYIDSSEGYVTDELDFRREHFVGEVPLVWDPETFAPAHFRGLIVFEYVQAIARDVRAMGKFMMANGTPGRICWLVPLLDVLGTETNWNPGGQWRPMSDAELLYRRALCAGKPYCFLMNTDFDQFGPQLVEKYMKRSLAYGMFPGFFSPNASTGHYFTRPELYERDRGLFRKYVPLCRTLAEAGWQPITRARSSHPQVYVERFGNRYFTVFNDSSEPCEVTISWDPAIGQIRTVRDLLTGQQWALEPRGSSGQQPVYQLSLRLGPEDVALLDIAPDK